MNVIAAHIARRAEETRSEQCHTVWALLFFTLDTGLMARSQYSEGPATDHLDTGFSWFPRA